MSMKRREFLAAGLALPLAPTVIALAQGGAGDAARRRPHGEDDEDVQIAGMYPNALAVMTDAPGGLWIGQQKITASNSKTYNLPVLPDPNEAAWLVDWNGKLVKTVMTPSRNTSGMAYGGGCVWMGANSDPYGIFQVDMNSKLISHRQIPLSIDGSGSGCHGVKWHNGKLWIAALRLGGILRVDPKTWVPEVLIRASSEEKPRLHDVCFDNEGNIWVVTGNNSTSYTEGKAGLNKYDGKTGQLLMTVDLRPDRAIPTGSTGTTDDSSAAMPASTGMEGSGKSAQVTSSGMRSSRSDAVRARR